MSEKPRGTCGLRPVVKTSPDSQGLTPGVMGSSHNTPSSFLPDPSFSGAERTVPCVLGPLESARSVAARFGMTTDELRKLNQLRTFARGFDNIRQGDEIDVPLHGHVQADTGAASGTLTDWQGQYGTARVTLGGG